MRSVCFHLSFLVQFKRVDQVPGDRFSFAVFVSCENDARPLSWRAFGDFRRPVPLFRDDIGRLKVVLYVDADLAFREIADMAVGRFDDKILADEFADRFCLGGGFNDD